VLPQLLRDYSALRHAGRRPYLTVGPWSHSSNALFQTSLRESLIWLRAHVFGDTAALRTAPVRIYVMGADEWREASAWPPEGLQAQRWYLQPGHGLAAQTPPESGPDRYRYDPADPTPNVAGAINTTLGRGSGARDNRTLESRADVLVYTSEVLERDVEVIGPVSADLYTRSSLQHADFFVRLCDVHTDGRSMNVCDGIQRVFPNEPAPAADDIRKVAVSLWPTAYRFRAGHRLRVQVSSGAFPRFARNLGTGESMATATAMSAAEHEIFHDPGHPSAVVLPVCE
jgi:putative CocE/NonD family hydrolase